MLLTTKHFGDLEYTEEQVIFFDDAIPGFPMETQFLMITEHEGDQFFWLQSAVNGDLAFVLVDIAALMPDYKPTFDSEHLKGMGENYKYYCIATVPEEITDMTVNLKAPVLISEDGKIGKQVIILEDYPVRRLLFIPDSNEEIQEKEAKI